jgi:hypothetical protein
MKRSEKTHERFDAESGIFNLPRAVRYLLEAKLSGTAFELACVVEAKYTTARVAVPG